MRKTIMLGTLIVLFGAGALAQAKDVTTTEPTNAVEATKPDTPAVRSEATAPERRSASHEEHREGQRKHHDGARERHDEHQKHDRRH